MEVKIIKIGNSKGIRFPKKILDQYHIEDRVKFLFIKDRIIIEPIKNKREGWENQFKEMNKKGEDKLLVSDVFEDENNLEEWT